MYGARTLCVNKNATAILTVNTQIRGEFFVWHFYLGEDFSRDLTRLLHRSRMACETSACVSTRRRNTALRIAKFYTVNVIANDMIHRSFDKYFETHDVLVERENRYCHRFKCKSFTLCTNSINVGTRIVKRKILAYYEFNLIL